MCDCAWLCEWEKGEALMCVHGCVGEGRSIDVCVIFMVV